MLVSPPPSKDRRQILGSEQSAAEDESFAREYSGESARQSEVPPSDSTRSAATKDSVAEAEPASDPIANAQETADGEARLQTFANETMGREFLPAIKVAQTGNAGSQAMLATPDTVEANGRAEKNGDLTVERPKLNKSPIHNAGETRASTPSEIETTRSDQADTIVTARKHSPSSKVQIETEQQNAKHVASQSVSTAQTDSDGFESKPDFDIKIRRRENSSKVTPSTTTGDASAPKKTTELLKPDPPVSEQLPKQPQSTEMQPPKKALKDSFEHPAIKVRSAEGRALQPQNTEKQTHDTSRVPDAVASRPDFKEPSNSHTILPEPRPLPPASGRSRVNTANDAVSTSTSRNVDPVFGGAGNPVPVWQAAPTALTNGRTFVEQNIAPQLTAAVATRNSGGVVEVLLEPPELGRVEISIELSDQGLRATLSAERQATVDLLRRHLESLAQQFEGAGFAEVEVDVGSFNSEVNQNSDDGTPEFGKGESEQSRTEDRPTLARQVLGSSHLVDIRL